MKISQEQVKSVQVTSRVRMKFVTKLSSPIDAHYSKNHIDNSFIIRSSRALTDCELIAN